MVIEGDADFGQLVLEISCDGGANFAPVTSSPIKNPPLKTLYGKTNRDIAETSTGTSTGTDGMVAQFARIRRQTGGGVASASLGSETTTDNLFATITSTPVDTSALGPIKTVVCVGTYDPVVVVEGSVDGVNYDVVCQFDTKNSDVKYVVGSYALMRLRGLPGGVPPSGSVSVGGGSASGPDGPQGPQGPQGAQGAVGGELDYSMFYGLTTGTGNGGPNDYAATIAVKTSAGTGRVPFPRLGPTSGIIVPVDASSFRLPAIGTYEITFKLHTTEPCQFEIEVDGAEVPESVTQDYNPTSGGHFVFGSAIIQTDNINAVVAIINPPGNSTALTITPANGALTHANAMSITIKRLA